MLRNARTSSNNCVIHVPSRSRVFPGFSRRFPEFADFSKIFPETTQPRLLSTTLVSLWIQAVPSGVCWSYWNLTLQIRGCFASATEIRVPKSAKQFLIYWIYCCNFTSRRCLWQRRFGCVGWWPTSGTSARMDPHGLIQYRQHSPATFWPMNLINSQGFLTDFVSFVGASARCGANFALAKREGNGGPSGCSCRIRAKSQSCGPQNRLQRWCRELMRFRKTTRSRQEV